MESVNVPKRVNLPYQPLNMLRRSTEADMIDMNKDTRKSHFQFGNAETDYVSHAEGTLVQHPITSENMI